MVTPKAFLGLGPAKLKRIGFSRQKAGYCRALARELLDGHFDLQRLECLDDSQAKAALMRLKGVGPWTADIYLLMALLRPDVFPRGDIALIKALCQVKRLSASPSGEQIEEICRTWSPWRSVAARLLWHHYLSSSGRDNVDGQ